MKNKKRQFFGKNRRGWIKIAEAFVGILLLSGIVLFVIDKENEENKLDISDAVQDVEISILREIQLNSTLRAEVLATNGMVDWANFQSQVPNTYAKIQSKIPSYLDCEAKICDAQAVCTLSGMQNKNVYAESVIVTSTLNNFKPRLLKLFCWEK